jgi:DNA-binding NarL/FixJ family response regulator
VLVVQDHPLLAAAIARLLQSEEDLTVCGIARGGDDAAVIAANQNPAVVLMDFRLPDLSGPAAAAKIRSAVPAAAIVFHSAEGSEDALLDAIDAGATAYLTKSATAEEIIEAVRKAALGETLIPARLFAMAIARQQRAAIGKRARDKLLAEFTPRELDVLREIAEGHDTQMLAMRLGIAPHTVAWHVSNLMAKLRVHSKLQAVVAAARLGLIEL